VAGGSSLHTVVSRVPNLNSALSIFLLVVLGLGSWHIFVSCLDLLPVGFSVVIIACYMIYVCIFQIFVSNEILWLSSERCFARSRAFPWLVGSIQKEAIIKVDTSYVGPHISLDDIIFSISEDSQNANVSGFVFWRTSKEMWRVNLVATDSTGTEAVFKVRQWLQSQERSHGVLSENSDDPVLSNKSDDPQDR